MEGHSPSMYLTIFKLYIAGIYYKMICILNLKLVHNVIAIQSIGYIHCLTIELHTYLYVKSYNKYSPYDVYDVIPNSYHFTI